MNKLMNLENKATQYQNELNTLSDKVSILQFLLSNGSISNRQFRTALIDLKSSKSISNKDIYKSVQSIWIKYAKSAEYGYGESIEVFMNDHYTNAPSLL